MKRKGKGVFTDFFFPQRAVLLAWIGFIMLAFVPSVMPPAGKDICLTKPCPPIKVQSPFFYPFSWLFSGKECGYCTLMELVQNPFVFNILNVLVLLGYFYLLACGLVFLIQKQLLRERPGKEREKAQKHADL